ncbi:MAG: hypothetical protein L0Y56_06205 [Nitrospira sp.]|nr:hypothetical protein [Nitrospira sp.]
MFQVILFTNRNLIVFDGDGKQHDLQNAVDCYEIDQELLEELLQQPARFFLSKWAKWKHEITKREFEYLLGQRTHEKDLADLEAQQLPAKGPEQFSQ